MKPIKCPCCGSEITNLNHAVLTLFRLGWSMEKIAHSGLVGGRIEIQRTKVQDIIRAELVRELGLVELDETEAAFGEEVS